MKPLLTACLIAAIASRGCNRGASQNARAESSNVVADIAPIHALVARLMKKGHRHFAAAGHLPHGSAMKPSNAEALAAAGPDNAALYGANAARMATALRAQHDALQQALGPLQRRPFITTHDAFYCFEERFGIEASSTLSLSDAALRVRGIWPTCASSWREWKPPASSPNLRSIQRW